MKPNKIALHLILALLLINIAEAEKYFVLDINYIIGSVTFNSISLRDIGRIIEYNDKSGFLVKTVSFDNSDIQKIYYNLSVNKNYIIYVPYSQNAARVEVYNLKNSKVMDIDVSSFSDTCGNSICEWHESYESCTKDCPSGSKDDFCDEAKDGVCDPDCTAKADADCEILELKGTNESVATKTKQEKQLIEEPKEKPNYIIWILLALISIILALSFLFIKKRKENQTIISLRQYISENTRKGFTLQQIKDALYREGYSEREIDRAVKPT
ncbi:hypothetical protein HYX04_00060 [Candidatus Woesearchaeota archaeon]|nr:hypothetical protein [Candidatus Woesearchaeota archaeon]